MKIKHRIIIKYCFVSIETFQQIIIYMLLETLYFASNKLTQIGQKRVPKEYVEYCVL